MKIKWNIAWNVCNTMIFKMFYRSKIIFHGLLRTRPDTRILVQEGGRLQFGQDNMFQHNVSISAVQGGQIITGDNVSFNRNCILICRKAISIGNNVAFGPNVCIYDHDHKFSYDGIIDGYNTTPVIIGDGCWIGANVTILRGAVIGEKCVIGAGTIIQGNIPAHSLVTNERKLRIEPIEKRNC